MFLKPRGLTLIEILLIMGILAILISISLPLALDFYKLQQLDLHTQQIVQTLRRAQQKAMSVEENYSFGVYLTNENYILFRGDSYNPDDPFNEVFGLPKIITLSGLSEVIFSKVKGLPNENPAYCGGNCLSCENLNVSLCRLQAGCDWNARLKICEGACILCHNFLDEKDCQKQLGCSWYPAQRGGNIILSIDNASSTININEIGRITLQ